MIFGATAVLTRAGQEEEELEVVELEDELLAAAHVWWFTVVLLKVIAAVWAIALPLSVAPPPVKLTDAEAKTVPTIWVVPSKVAEESTFQKTLQA